MALIVKPQPFTREVDRLFDAFFGVGGERDSRRWVPAMDLVEADDHFVLKADLPGLAEDDVAIEVQDGTLTLTGERSGEDVGEGGGWVRIERAYGGFSRSLTLPDGVDADGIVADFDRGVLTIQIPKPAERKPRRVEIGSGNGTTPRTVESTATEK
ncbi:MAG: Hsp20/alpha crystallin family protein [Thermoleophilaceae bacterium]|nr:Hsp20/alpha crystallin family protein [Thermoleophilaceae bacterium]